jgi:hypothetical protein
VLDLVEAADGSFRVRAVDPTPVLAAIDIEEAPIMRIASVSWPVPDRSMRTSAWAS